MMVHLGRFRDGGGGGAAASSVVMAAAAPGDLGARTKPAAVTEQEGTAVCAVVVQSVGR